MARLLIIGLPGAGKTQLAWRLAQELGVPHIEADRLFWISDRRENPEFRKLVRLRLEEKNWVFEGHFSKVQDIALPRAQAVIWLKPPFFVVLYRFLRRSWRHPQRGGTLSWLLTHRRSSTEIFRAAIQRASSAGLFTLTTQSGFNGLSQAQWAALRAALGLGLEKS